MLSVYEWDITEKDNHHSLVTRSQIIATQEKQFKNKKRNKSTRENIDFISMTTFEIKKNDYTLRSTDIFHGFGFGVYSIF